MSCAASNTSCSGLLQEVQYHPTDCWIHQLLNRLDRRGRCETLHCSSTAPSPTGPTDLLCHCKWEKNLAVFITGIFSQERTQCQLQFPAVCQHPKREPGAGQDPKAFLWSMMTTAGPSTVCSSPITTLWSTTCDLQFALTVEVPSRIFLSPC